MDNKTRDERFLKHMKSSSMYMCSYTNLVALFQAYLNDRVLKHAMHKTSLNAQFKHYCVSASAPSIKLREGCVKKKLQVSKKDPGEMENVSNNIIPF